MRLSPIEPERLCSLIVSCEVVEGASRPEVLSSSLEFLPIRPYLPVCAAPGDS